MRFELSVALKYLVPRWRQLSVAIISLVSTLVVAMVVWLVLVFLSVTDGLEKKWVEELVSLNAPLRLSPTEAYYDSYYYQIDSIAADSNYNSKSLGEKLLTRQTDPYDPTFDSEIPLAFPSPYQNEAGDLKDLVKEADQAISSFKEKYKGLRSKEYEISFGTVQLKLQHRVPSHEQSYVSQISYIASHSLQESKLNKMIMPPTPADYQNFLNTLSLQSDSPSSFFHDFFSHVEVIELAPMASGYPLPESLYPLSGKIEAFALLQRGKLEKILIPHTKLEEEEILQELSEGHKEFSKATIDFSNKIVTLPLEEIALSSLKNVLFVTPHLRFNSTLEKDSLANALHKQDLRFTVETAIQNLPIKGIVSLDHLLFSTTKALPSNMAAPWLCPKGRCSIPKSGDEQGIIISKHFKKNGVLLGDRGSILYTSPSLHSVQEQKLPIFVAGFYDPGLFPMGSKLIFVEPEVTTQLRSNVSISDALLGNGLHIWLDQNEKAEQLKEELKEELESRGIAPYWKVESFNDYEFAKPILTQLKSDKNLFTLIAIIILLVACSNIISMLILLVNDKKREIAIIQAMGASSTRIALIFGMCGFFIGLFSSIVGIALSIFTLRHLQSLVDFLSFLQGHDAFHAAFFGSELPNQLSISALLFVFIATTLLSLIAALVPAIKAAKIRPSQMLRSEG